MNKELIQKLKAKGNTDYTKDGDFWRHQKPIAKGSYGGGLGHCDKCKNPRMTYVHCVKGLKQYCDKHIGGE